MSEVKHTPGPWKAEGDQVWGYDEEGQQIVIAVTAGAVPDRFNEDAPWLEANASLIAAAPELLNTILAYKFHHKIMLEIAGDTDCPCKICKMAEAVISKAKDE